MTRLPMMTIAALLLTAGAAAAAAPAADIEGNWARTDGTARMKMAACGSQVCAVNTWIKDPSSGEAVGDRLVMALAPDGDNVLTGEAYDSKRDRSYAMTITVEADGMRTRGCIMAGLLCKSTSWSRIP